MLEAGGAVMVALLLALAWGRTLEFLHDRSDAFRRLSLVVMTVSARPPSEVRALLLAALYYSVGLTASVVMVALYGLPPSATAPVPLLVWTIVLGIVGEISLTSLLVDLSRRVMGARPERFAEIEQIPWIVGLRQLPPGTAPAAAAA